MPIAASLAWYDSGTFRSVSKKFHRWDYDKMSEMLQTGAGRGEFLDQVTKELRESCNDLMEAATEPATDKHWNIWCAAVRKAAIPFLS